uniref:Uncharacterized protein n=1 Tax=Chromera velia CCMP2878 TaxID=1169474 RepID=A0A0G4I7A9_9ALVE|eukprot:Cvel_36508.t1-p1 / transcript=Cvel_36508.t1 / gene=Cvel_36508 / organism=Chromera_velia_CCMP2878 / gene_product=hypothetical protein / transcript_product=hypothetical protein / location=Cvel_scaffold7364:7-420(-) / protein_length=138 / sequence_SO=supercontig / SO=protein_coding / is_pseudo=false
MDVLVLTETRTEMTMCSLSGGGMGGTNYPLEREGRMVTATGGIAVLLSRRARELGFQTERATEAAVFVQAPGFPLIVGLYDPPEDSTHENDGFLEERKWRKREEKESKEGTNERMKCACAGTSMPGQHEGGNEKSRES